MNRKNWKARAAALLLGLCFLVVGAVPAFATSANIQLNKKGSIHITLYDRQNDMAVRGGELTLYKVADAQRKNGDLSFRYTGEFEGCTIALGDLTDSTLAAKLEAYLPENPKGTTHSVDENGTVEFTNLPLGLYLVVQTEASRGYAAIQSFLVSVPLKDGTSWLYDVDATPKVGTITPSPEPEEPDVPETPDKPDTPDTPVTPDKPTQPETPTNPETPENPDNPDSPVSPGNPDSPVSPGNPDNPVAPGSPDNPVAPGHPDNPVLPGHADNPVLSGLPQTGQLNWPVPVMAIGGMVLFAIGWVLTKKETPL